ncbi:DUF4232 domain-containing protein [Streptomyces sp. S.PB5]|uniref:DUF4232 domain-containing protein n=1 Tax=Streptomyces sp. S.PB5 TaxID=3020844 RepID=UPI0025B1C378|nr:DUF4232 domain-containing protein [Streptomyces sp. S.PB5]MDN3026308.1 DUF4232 domain-containing protein [Streptomyces sp. S.PB5]
MRALPLATTALAAALLLTACSDDDGGDTTGAEKKKGGSACAIGEMTVTAGPANAAPAAGDTGNVPVTITNKSGAACTLDGLPGVRFETGDATIEVAADQAASAAKSTLAKDADTSFTITYVRGEAGADDSLAVKSVKFGLPGSSETDGFEWSYGDVALKDGKPDASFSGFQRTGD